MATIKNAFLRHRILDRCFRERGRRYYMNDLIEIINKETFYYYGRNISERTIREDLKYMKDSEGYSAPIEKGMDGHRAYYYYGDPEYSIMNLPISQKEMQQLADTISMLSRFKGLPDFSWMEEIIVRLEDTFQLNQSPRGVVSFAQNPYLIGMQHFTALFDCIVKKYVIKVSYHKYRKPSFLREIHPYQLRQYNNRWFLIGYESKMKGLLPLVTLPLDRIDAIDVAPNLIYQEYHGLDIDEYFSQVVGVSINIGSRRERIIIKATFPAAAYIETKPFHNSQKILDRKDNYIVFELNLIPNYEFETSLLGYLNECEILEPLYLRKKMRERALKIIENNQ
ncbi:WYL domain-containing protein [uncultured Duncaniella sp.]|uniref:helix-turn-helix transcriptional regulator n=1 Tax=uncultured Duncaniella sp. TaxID=2768039 RepID=UPI00263745B7|nr:WYL domain-containing protein [uncultured Duncaniella sp.]